LRPFDEETRAVIPFSVTYIRIGIAVMTKLIHFLTEHKREIQSDPLEADLALFSRLAELPFELILEKSTLPVRLIEASTLLLQFLDQDATPLTLPADRQLLKQIIASNRYVAVEITDFFTNQTDFFALTFDITKTAKVVTYRGPNGALLSWQADLHFSQSTVAPLAKLAQNYLLNALATDNKDIICVGFSKGAALVALACNRLTVDSTRLVRAVLLDSPGLPNANYHFQIPIVELVAPLSIFALIGEHPAPQVIINSTATGIWQHDPYSWTVDSTGSFERTIGITDPTVIAHQFQSLLPEKITDKNIHRSIDQLFELFNQLEYDRVAELIKHWNQFNSLIQTTLTDENIVVKMTINRIQKNIFKNAALQLQSKPLQ
jgi:hypothetical protein